MSDWCESSAVAAVTRHYATAKAAAADHLILTNALNDREKGQFLRLAERYGEYLALAQVDANSKLAASAISTARQSFMIA